MRLLLGVDVGTTGVRAGIFDERGRRAAEASAACPPRTAASGRAEADAEGWWTAVCEVCRRIGQGGSLGQIAGIGVTGQAPTAVLVDGDARPLRPAILWLDVRAAAEARAIDAALGPGRAEALGGNRMHAYYLGPKLAWLRTHEPAALDRTAYVMQSHAFVVLRLTGRAACDPSTAMLCSPLYDARVGTWSEQACRAVGIESRVLPPLMASHEVLGSVTRAAAAATGLREGTPVVAGGGDFAASALGAGVVEEGQACLMLGTAGNLLLPTNEPRFDPRLIHSRHVGCDRWLALGGTLCGGALEWYRSVFAADVAWETLEAEAAAVDLAGSDLLFVPYLQGERTPIWDEGARGVLVGLDLAHGRAHILRALIEGIALGFRHCLSVAEEHGLRLAQVVAANGAGRSALLRQTLADALGMPLVWSGDGGGTLAGAAILAGLGTGVLSSAPSAGGADVWTDGGRRGDVRHEPDPASHARLTRLFARRLALDEAVRTRR